VSSEQKSLKERKETSPRGRKCESDLGKKWHLKRKEKMATLLFTVESVLKVEGGFTQELFLRWPDHERQSDY